MNQVVHKQLGLDLIKSLFMFFVYKQVKLKF